MEPESLQDLDATQFTALMAYHQMIRRILLDRMSAHFSFSSWQVFLFSSLFHTLVCDQHLELALFRIAILLLRNVGQKHGFCGRLNGEQSLV